MTDDEQADNRRTLQDILVDADVGPDLDPIISTEVSVLKMTHSGLKQVRAKYYGDKPGTPGWAKHTAAIEGVITQIGLLIKRVEAQEAKNVER